MNTEKQIKKKRCSDCVCKNQETAEKSQCKQFKQLDEADSIKACQAELQEWKEKFVRVHADLENFTRRIEKERMKWMLVARVDLVKDLLTVVDNFGRALSQQDDQKLSPEMATWIAGFSMIGTSLDDILRKYGLQEITEATTFDPTIHEAVVQIESKDHESGAIVEVLQKGYRLNDQVLRPVKISVAK